MKQVRFDDGSMGIHFIQGFRDRKLSGKEANDSGQRHSLPVCFFQ